MPIHYFQVAGLQFAVTLPCEAGIGLLPSFRPFAIGEEQAGDRLFTLSVVESDCKPAHCELLEESDNDMGHLCLFATNDGYRVEIHNKACCHSLWADRQFHEVKACLDFRDRLAGNALSSMLRISFAQAALGHDAISIHAAAVSCDGRAYLFMGKSGTGKSTHASLWLKHIPATELLNDDNPVVRVVGDKVYAYGTPWSGKTHCYKNRVYPVGGIVRLHQAACNRFAVQEGADAFVAIYPGCSVILQDSHLRDLLYNTLTRIAETVPVVGRLWCRPDREAALLCHCALLEAAGAQKTNQ